MKNVKVLSRAWKIFLIVLFLNGIAIMCNVSIGVYQVTRGIHSLTINTILAFTVDELQEMTEETVSEDVAVLNALRNFLEEREIYIRYKEVVDSSDSQILHTGKNVIELGYEQMSVGKRIVAISVESNLLKKLHLKSEEFENPLDVLAKLQSEYGTVKKNSGGEVYFTGGKYSAEQIVVMQSYIPLLLVLHNETVHDTERVVDVLRAGEFLFSEQIKGLQAGARYSQTVISFINNGLWPLTFSSYLWKNYREKIYFFNIISLLSETLKWLLLFNVLVFLGVSVSRRDFWDIVNEEMTEQGLPLSFSTLCLMVCSHWRAFLFPRSVDNTQKLIQKWCEDIKQEKERKILRAKANKIFCKINDLADVDESHLGTLRHYYDAVVNPSGNIGRAWRNLTRLEQQLRNIKLRQQIGSVDLDFKVTQSQSKSKRVKGQRNRDLVNALCEMLPTDHTLKLLTWSENNLHCLMRALIILPDLHPDAMSRLLRRRDIKALMMRRDPFMKAIETENKRIIFDRLNINLDRKQKSKLQKTALAQLPSELKVFVVGVGQAVKKKETFKRSIGDLGAQFGGFIHADNFRKVQSVARSARDKNVLIVLTKRHLNHQASTEMKNARNVVYVNSISSERFKYELIKGYHSL